MIIRMTTKPRPQQRYDHRLRDLVHRTGDVTLATDLGVPRSTARGWLRAAPTVVSLDVTHLSELELQQEILRLRRRVQKLAALLQLVLALLRTSGFTLSRERLPDGRAKMRILRAVDRARACIPLRALLRLLRLSPSRSKNSLRHGLLSKDVTLPEEDSEAFAEVNKRMSDQFAPEGPLEELLVERLAASVWRLRRVVCLEAGVIAFRTTEARTELAASSHDGNSVALGLIRDATGADALSKLSRYERGLERGLYRALHELQRLQAARRDEDVPPPAVLDVQVSGGDP